MSTLLFSHAGFLDHETPYGHPERPDRLRAVEAALQGEAFAPLVREEARPARMASLLLCHPEEHVARLMEARPQTGDVYLDSDTVMSPGTWDAALRAVGGAVSAVDAVMEGRARNAFLAARPPGHHAERDRAMGFCFFNTAAIAARHARARHGARRVCVIDWDVHHGNGTQDIFWDDPDALYVSTHQMPLYPGTGGADERGGHDNILNIPLHAGDGGSALRDAFDHAIIPRLTAFRPEIVVISAGFDGHRRDPLGGLDLTEADFAWATRALMSFADAHCGGRVVSVLEGGYDLQGLGLSVAAHVGELMKG